MTQIDKATKITFIVLGVIVVLPFLIGSFGNIEPRSLLAQWFLDGHLYIVVLLLIVFGGLVRGIYFIAQGKCLSGFASTISFGLAFMVIGFIAAFDFGDLGNYNKDHIVYKSTKSTKRLIAQYYETGIGGNPHWRVIIVDDIDAKFRSYKESDFDFNKGENGFIYVLGDHVITSELLPKTISADNDTFILENVIPFDDNMRFRNH